MGHLFIAALLETEYRVVQLREKMRVGWVSTKRAIVDQALRGGASQFAELIEACLGSL